MCVFVYVYIYTYRYIYIYIYISVYICMCVYAQICNHTCRCVYIYIYVCVYVQLDICVICDLWALHEQVGMQYLIPPELLANLDAGGRAAHSSRERTHFLLP